MKPGEWCHIPQQGRAGLIMETQTLWGETVCRVWFPDRNAVELVPAQRLRPAAEVAAPSADEIVYIATAARAAEALTRDVLLAPLEASVIPLPHQIQAVARAVAGDSIRYLLADEVGLGKTIEAGLIMRELKLRGLVRRTLVIAPRGLVTQWVAEMRTHFHEDFCLLTPRDLEGYRWAGDHNPWQDFPQVVCPMDSVKPVRGRRGWTRERIRAHNRERFENLLATGWDLIIVDEAHRLAGSSDLVARHQLGQGLAEAAPYLLLLSATPHQGKRDAFHRLLSLLDAQAFPEVESVTREQVQPYVIRTEKRKAVDAEGKPLFKPRRTELFPVSWRESHRSQRLLYEAVSNYVREGYNQAVREKRTAAGFLLLLMQRLVVSSTRAIRTTLERRLEVLGSPPEQLFFSPVAAGGEGWSELDAQEQLEVLLGHIEALRNERAEVQRLLDAATLCERQGPDAKAEALLDWIYRLQAEEGDPQLKVLVFTEFIPTQEMLREFLTARGFEVVCLNGTMDMEERQRVQEAFAGDARILVSTDAGGEGLNLQFCHVVINYDLPWNPMRLEQRIGRVDRIGQTHPVRAINLVLEGSVEYRVVEVLEQKLAVILEEFGVDKTGDVLDSAQAAEVFDELYREAVLNPAAVERKAEEVLQSLRDRAAAARASAALLGSGGEMDVAAAQRLLSHPLPHWLERLTVSYVRAHGGRAEKKDGGTWRLTWPDGETMAEVTFSHREAASLRAARRLTLEHPRVRALVEQLPRFLVGQPVPVIALPGLPDGLTGYWSLWQVTLTGQQHGRRRIFPLLLSDDGRLFHPSARFIWEQLLTAQPTIRGSLDARESWSVYERVRLAAEEAGRAVYHELVQAHREYLQRERQKAEVSLAARRRAIERLGLPEVRNHRLRLLEREAARWQEEIEQAAEVIPELVPLLLVRVEEDSGERLA